MSDEKQLDDIQKNIEFLVEHMASKEDLAVLNARLTQLEASIHELTALVEKFVKLHQDLIEENLAGKARMDRLEGRIEKLEEKLGVD